MLSGTDAVYSLMDDFDLADSFERAGDPTAACSAYQRCLVKDPSNASAAVNLAILLKYLGKQEAALAAHQHAQAMQPERRITDSCRLLSGGPIFGYAPCSVEERHKASCYLRTVLRTGGYGADAMQRRLQGLTKVPTGTELLLLRTQPGQRQSLLDGAQPEGVLLLLFAMGVALPRGTVASAVGEEKTARMIELGLLLHPPPLTDDELLASPVQVYPLALHTTATNDANQATQHEGLNETSSSPSSNSRSNSPSRDDLLLATDWDLEGMLPTKWAVMPIGSDSLNLVHLAPRAEGCSKLLDVCCGSGIQALTALATYAETAVAADVSPRAVAFTAFNAELNGLSPRLTAVVSDIYSAAHPLGPFDAILANPPFVAVPALGSGLDESTHWALYADGGPDGASVLRTIVASAKDDALLRPGGTLSMVSEYPNVRTAHEWLPALGDARSDARSDASSSKVRSSASNDASFDLSVDVSVDVATSRSGLAFAVCFEPIAHVQEADEYAADRADERGWPWANVQQWEESLKANGVDHMGSGLVFGVKRGSESTGACCPLRGPSREEDLSLLESSGDVVRAIRDALLAGADAGALESIARGHCQYVLGGDVFGPVTDI